MASVILVDLNRVSASRPDKPLFDDVSLTVSTGDRIGVVGLNGCGKSTLLRLMAGVDEPATGVRRVGQGVRVAFLDQAPVLAPGTVRQALGTGWEADALLDRLGLAELHDADVSTLSGGQAKRVALAQLLAREGDLLLLDEPTNHLDLETVAWLEDRLAAGRAGLVLVTHDRHVLDRVTNRILELDRGAWYVHEGGYDTYLAARADREEKATRAESSRRNLARSELAWLRRGAPARSRKPKAHIRSATALVEHRAQAPARAGDLDLSVGASRLGDKVIELRGAGFAHPDGPPLIQELDLLLDKGTRLGVVGPNGAGKSTLLDLLAGLARPTSGSIERGPTVKVGYHDQVGIELDLDQRVRDAVAGPTRVAGWEEDRLLERFWFQADSYHAPIGRLSGGERRRLQLLLILAQRPNVLLLDEPTNDLDLDTLRTLEDFLEDWSGALVVVSHDRAFMERTVEEVLALDGAGHAAAVPGGYPAWEAGRRARRPASGTGRRSPGRPTGDPARPGTEPGQGGRRPGRTSERNLVKKTEREIAALGRRRAAMEAELAAAGSDHVAMACIGRELADVHEAIRACEDRWLELTVE